jgi:hypothetical protein
MFQRRTPLQPLPRLTSHARVAARRTSCIPLTAVTRYVFWGGTPCWPMALLHHHTVARGSTTGVLPPTARATGCCTSYRSAVVCVRDVSCSSRSATLNSACLDEEGWPMDSSTRFSRRWTVCRLTPKAEAVEAALQLSSK